MEFVCLHNTFERNNTDLCCSVGFWIMAFSPSITFCFNWCDNIPVNNHASWQSGENTHSTSEQVDLVGIWLVYGWCVVGMWLVCGQYVVGIWPCIAVAWCWTQSLIHGRKFTTSNFHGKVCKWTTNKERTSNSRWSQKRPWKQNNLGSKNPYKMFSSFHGHLTFHRFAVEFLCNFLYVFRDGIILQIEKKYIISGM